MKSIKRYGFEGIVIIFGILFSFYVEELRVTSNKIETKNYTIPASSLDSIQISKYEKLLGDWKRSHGNDYSNRFLYNNKGLTATDDVARYAQQFVSKIDNYMKLDSLTKNLT